MNLQEPKGTATAAGDRISQVTLESWKEIAAYLQRDAKTARRWEKEEGLPVHRHGHNSRSSVYAYPSEIDAWRASRKMRAEQPQPVPTLWRWAAFAATMLLCLVTAGNGIRPASAQGLKAARQIWVTRAGDGPLSVSSDGRHFAFTDWRTGDLAVRDLRTGTDRRLTRTSGSQEAEAAVFSPDGRQIAYNWFTYKEPHQEEVLVIPVAGASPKRVWSSAGTEEWLVPQAWTPDGKQLLVMRSLPNHTSQLALLSIQDGSIHTLKSFEGQRFNASLSPDGRLIAYDSPSSPTTQARDIFVMSVDGGGETTVVQNPANDAQPVWSPDGARVLFLSNRTGRQALWSVPLINGKPGKEELVKDLSSAPRISLWMTRSGALYYMTPGEGGPNIYSAELSADMKVSKAPVLAIDTFINSNSVPTLSPNGEQMLYASFRGGSAGSTMIRNLKTGEEHVVPTEVPPCCDSARWFPDGRSVLILSNVPQGPGPNFYRIDSTTGKAELLFRSPARVQGFSLSPDGKTIFYSEPYRLVRFDIETKREAELRTVDSVIDSFYAVAVSPDGKQLAYVFWTGGLSSSVNVMPADGGPSREVVQASPWADYGRYNALAWNADQHYLLFTPSAGDNGQKALWRVPVSGGPAEQVGVSMPGLSTPQLHPDGHHLFFLSNDTGKSEIWALENFLPKTTAK